MKRPSMQIGLGIALGIGIGAAVAVVLGSGGMWLAIGIAVGVIVGKAMPRSKEKEVPGETSPLLARSTRNGAPSSLRF